jgi:F-type H+-transporting ATPase subunit delta
MKITANQYAKSLYAATKEKSQNEIKIIVANFIKILAKNRQVKLFSKISKKFAEIWNKENGFVEAKITSVKKLDEKNLKSIEKFIENKYSAKEVILNNVTNEKIKGGIIIKIGDEILDGSVTGQLERLRNNLIN